MLWVEIPIMPWVIGEASPIQAEVCVHFFIAADTHSALLFLSQIVLMVFDWYVKKVSIVQPCQ